MAAARPAGPPPATNTSHGIGKRFAINCLATNGAAPQSVRENSAVPPGLHSLVLRSTRVSESVRARFPLPLQQDEFRAESRTHGGQQTERAGSGAAILHDFFEHHQHRS